MGESSPSLLRPALAGVLALLTLVAVWLGTGDFSDSAPTPTPLAHPGSRPPAIPARRVEPAAVDTQLARVHGRVLDPSASPLTSATVCATQLPLALVPVTRCTTAGSDGEHTLELPAGTWMVGASAPGWAPSQQGPGRRSGRVSLRPGESRRFDLVLLEPGRVVRGVVHDALGGTIAGALVTIGSHPGITEAGAFASSNDDGEFEITLPQRNVMLSGYATGYFPSSTASRLGSDWVELTLAAETSVRGRVVWDIDASPVEGVEVLARGSGTRAKTNAAGHFEIAVDPSRASTLVVMHAGGHAQLELAAVAIGEPREVELRLVPAAELEVELVDADTRERCEDGFVRFEQAPLDVLGYVEFHGEPLSLSGLPVGEQRVRVGCQGTLEREETLELVAGPQRVELELASGPRLEGRVLAVDGSPAGLVQLRFVGERPASDVTDLEGEFEAEYLPPGIYELEARAPRLGQGAVVEVDLRADDVSIEVELVPWSAVRGRVVDADGVGVGGLALSLAEQPEPRSLGSVMTRADGSFEFAAIRSGTLALFAGGLRLAHVGEKPEQERVTLQHDQTRQSELELVVEARRRSVRLQLVDASGLAVPGLQVGVVRRSEVGLDFSAGQQTSDLEGVVVFGGLPEGELHLRWPDGSLDLLQKDRGTLACRSCEP